ncbi:hypothetical protein [Hymenobacter frigidus]|uniref:hypothetical protein n=1 Tax=Hymenobacter frigidus TaxID=1524095 RepID=UPI001664B019|nr:hypothetical protein [Hymenobacter frigidus]
MKQVKSSACTAATKAARKALIRSVSRSAAWTRFFSPPIQCLHRPPQRGRAHNRTAQRDHPPAQLFEGGIGLLAQAGHQLSAGHRVE